MARQSRKNKNELDIILEQLKKSYASDGSDTFEDDLLEKTSNDEDAELNEILGKIFSYEELEKSSESENEEPASEEAANDSDEFEVPSPADIPVDETCAEEIIDDNAPVEGSNVEYAETEQSQIAELDGEVKYDDKNEDITIESSAVVSDVDKIDESTAPMSDIEAVDNILDLMFSKKANTVHAEDVATPLESIIDASVEDILTEETDTSHSEENQYDVYSVNEIIENDIDNLEAESRFVEDFDESIEFEGFDEDVIVETKADDDFDKDLADEGSIFAVEDEEYDLNGDAIVDDSVEFPNTVDEALNERPFVPYPVPHIVLAKSQYTDDPLQIQIPHIDSNPGLEYLRDKQNDISTNETENKLDAKAKEESFDENDISLLLKFGYHDEIKSKVGEKKTKEVLLEADNTFVPDPTKKLFGYCNKEITNRKQIPEVSEKYKTNQRNLIILLSVVSTLALFLLYINISFEFFADKVAAFPLFLLFDLLLVLTMCGVLYKKIISGFNKLMKLGTSANTLFFIVAFAYVIYAVVSFIGYAIYGQNSQPQDLMLFGFFVSFYALLSLVSDLFNCIRERRAFNIIASSDVFYTAENVASTRNDKNVRREDCSKYRIRKTELISGYFRKTSFNEDLKIRPLYLLGIVPIVTLVSGITVFFLSKSFALSASIAMIALILSVPATYLFTSSLIRFILSKFKVDKNTAFIGNLAPEQMSKVRELIFDDKEAVEIIGYKSIIPGGKNDGEDSLKIARGIFCALGGTLADVDDNLEDEKIGTHEVSINHISDNGIDIYYDSSVNVLIGDKQYMQRHNIKVKTDANLYTATKGADRSVIYMAFDGIPKLGFIINSKIKPDFLKVSEKLIKNGVHTYVRTYEPHINELYFEQNKGGSMSMINTVKSDEYEDASPIDICDGCIISSSGAISLAKAIMESKDIYRYCRINQIINVFIIVINMLLVSVLSLFVLTDHSGLDIIMWFRMHIEPLTLGLVFASFIPALIEIIHIVKKQ